MTRRNFLKLILGGLTGLIAARFSRLLSMATGIGNEDLKEARFYKSDHLAG